jgi:hypothetical protein
VKRTPIRRVSQKKRKRMAGYAIARQEVYERSGGRCEFTNGGERCRHPHEQTHHKRRRSQGGTDDLENLIGLCSMHHDLIHANPEWAEGLGYLIRSRPEPLSSAVLKVEPTSPRPWHDAFTAGTTLDDWIDTDERP